ncbi:MAG: serine protease [Bacteriovorax sp.]|jgi:hypothetical protein
MVKIFFYTVLFGQIFNLSAPAAVLKIPKHSNAIYEIDDRRLVDSKSSVNVRTLSESIAMIISSDSVEKKFLSSRIFAGLLKNSERLNFCSGGKFAEHHSLNACTGFLVGVDLLATAGHCFASESDCMNKSVVFNVLAKNEVAEGYKVPVRNTYGCKEIVSRVIDVDRNIDYAVIRLDRKASGREVLKLRSNGRVGSGDKVFMIGHPLGLPQVVTNSASLLDNSQPHFFKAALDSFEGNSGSPVFNSSTLEVEGILVRGEEDFLLDQSLQCYRDQIYNPGEDESSGSRGEGVSRISDILPSLYP